MDRDIIYSMLPVSKILSAATNNIFEKRFTIFSFEIFKICQTLEYCLRLSLCTLSGYIQVLIRAATCHLTKR